MTLVLRRVGKGHLLDQYDFGHDPQLAAIQVCAEQTNRHMCVV
jgi:hypothetical protein